MEAATYFGSQDTMNEFANHVDYAASYSSGVSYSQAPKGAKVYNAAGLTR